MTTAEQIEEAPEWAAARNDWRAQADGALANLREALASAAPGALARETVYGPVHDMAGLAPVFQYELMGQAARSLMEKLRHGPDPLDAPAIEMAKAYVSALTALHAKDVRGPVGADGEALLAKLASAGI